MVKNCGFFINSFYFPNSKLGWAGLYQFCMKMDKLRIALKVFDVGLYIADIYSDFATTALYYNTCQDTFFYISIGIFISSYFTTVFGLRYFTYYQQKWKVASFYPVFAVKILIQKTVVSLFSKDRHLIHTNNAE